MFIGLGVSNSLIVSKLSSSSSVSTAPSPSKTTSTAKPTTNNNQSSSSSSSSSSTSSSSGSSSSQSTPSKPTPPNPSPTPQPVHPPVQQQTSQPTSQEKAELLIQAYKAAAKINTANQAQQNTQNPTTVSDDNSWIDLGTNFGLIKTVQHSMPSFSILTPQDLGGSGRIGSRANTIPEKTSELSNILRNTATNLTAIIATASTQTTATLLRIATESNAQISAPEPSPTLPQTRITAVDDKGINLLANMERSPSDTNIVFNRETGAIQRIYTTNTDIGFGRDISQRPMATTPAWIDATTALQFLKEDASIDAERIATLNIYDQDQFNALVSLRFNIGAMSNVDGLYDYLRDGTFDRDTMGDLIHTHYDNLINANSALEQYRVGWENRTERFLDVFFDGNYGNMPIDIVNGRIIQ